MRTVAVSGMESAFVSFIMIQVVAYRYRFPVVRNYFMTFVTDFDISELNSVVISVRMVSSIQTPVTPRSLTVHRILMSRCCRRPWSWCPSRQKSLGFLSVLSLLLVTPPPAPVALQLTIPVPRRDPNDTLLDGTVLSPLARVTAGHKSRIWSSFEATKHLVYCTAPSL